MTTASNATRIALPRDAARIRRRFHLVIRIDPLDKSIHREGVKRCDLDNISRPLAFAQFVQLRVNPLVKTLAPAEVRISSCCCFGMGQDKNGFSDYLCSPPMICRTLRFLADITLCNHLLHC